MEKNINPALTKYKYPSREHEELHRTLRKERGSITRVAKLAGVNREFVWGVLVGHDTSANVLNAARAYVRQMKSTNS